MSVRSVALPSASAEVERRQALAGSALARLVAGTAAMAQAEMRKIRHDYVDLFTR